MAHQLVLIRWQATKWPQLIFTPANANALFYVDDFYYSPRSLCSQTQWYWYQWCLSCTKKTFTGSKAPLGVKLTNLGANTANNVEIEFAYGAITGKKTITGFNLASLETKTVNFDEELTVLSGSNPIQVSAKLVGSDDDDVANNASSFSRCGRYTAEDKLVIAEEEWHLGGWCPRGAVMLDRLSKKYPDYFIGIAVHKQRPNGSCRIWYRYQRIVWFYRFSQCNCRTHRDHWSILPLKVISFKNCWST